VRLGEVEVFRIKPIRVSPVKNLSALFVCFLRERVVRRMEFQGYFESSKTKDCLVERSVHYLVFA
jgi:hypothetical protein